jgi:hypothetical protein
MVYRDERNADENIGDEEVSEHYAGDAKKSSTQDAFDKHLGDYTSDTPDTSSVASVAKLPTKKTSENKGAKATQPTKSIDLVGAIALVALVIGSLIYRRVRSHRNQDHMDMDESNFISKPERNNSISRSNQVYESPHIVDIRYEKFEKNIN